MSRPLIREPDLVKRWASGDRAKAQCLSDNQCFGPGMAGEGVYCVTKKQEETGEGPFYKRIASMRGNFESRS
jgi:hypothetical protein